MRVILTKLWPCIRIHQFLGPTLNIATLKTKLTGTVVHQCIQERYRRCVVPCTTHTYCRALALHSATFEYISLVTCRTVISRQRIASAAIFLTLLAVQQVVLEIDAAVTADKINRSVDLAILKVLNRTLQVAVIRILITQQLHVLANSLRSLIPQCHSTAIVVLVVIQCILNSQVLQIRSTYVLIDLNSCRLVNTLFTIVRSILNNCILHRLTNKRDIVLTNGCQHGLAEIIHTSWQKYLIARLSLN